MLGPIIDTIFVCTMTALALIITGVWQTSDADGITLTASAFESAIPGFGAILLTICVSVFAISTMLSFPYYGTKCFNFLFGAHNQHWYNYLYILTIIWGCIASIGAVINLIDSMFAMMAIPTMISATLLSPKVVEASKVYFRNLSSQEYSR